MKIIDNKKDYYDYLSGVYGIDNLITYDRRGSEVLSNRTWDVIFNQHKHYNDTPRSIGRRYNNAKKKFEKELLGQIFYCILEVGYKHYWFKVERYLDDNDSDVLHYIPTLIKNVDVKDKITTAPMAYIPAAMCGHPYFGNQTLRPTRNKGSIIENPILKDTLFTQIPPNEIWNNLYNYFSSLKDKPIIDSRTDIEKIESHGFDKKTSFRHPVK